MKTLKKIVAIIGTLFLGTLFLCLFVALFLGPPLALVLESIDIVRLRSTAPGKVTEITMKRGGHGTSRAVISYSFIVHGQQFQSDRFFPGFFANHLTWTGGGAIARNYAAGQPITVHFNPNNPSCCALEQGWSKVSVGFFAVGWGLVLSGISQRNQTKARRRNWVLSVGLASTVYGFALLFFAPPAVRLPDLHWHGLAWCAAFAVVVLYHWVKDRSASEVPRPDGEQASA